MILGVLVVFTFKDASAGMNDGGGVQQTGEEDDQHKIPLACSSII